MQYLYLLFDESNPLNHDDSNGVFTTEGHYLVLDKKLLRPPPKSRKGEAQTCPRYDPVHSSRMHPNSSKSLHELQPGILFRKDMEYARTLVGVISNPASAISRGLWSESGFCESPSVQVTSPHIRSARLSSPSPPASLTNPRSLHPHCPQVRKETDVVALLQDYVLSLLFAEGDQKEDSSPSLSKVRPDFANNSYHIRQISGLRIQITRRVDDTGGYDITRIGPYRISSSSTVYISDPAVVLALNPKAFVPPEGASFLDRQDDARVDLVFRESDGTEFLRTAAAKAAFGPDFLHAVRSLATDESPEEGSSLRVSLLPDDNLNACAPVVLSYGSEAGEAATVAVALRGNCTFVRKMQNAMQAGAAALLVLSDEEELLVPSADSDELAAMPRLIPVALLPKSSSDRLLRHLRLQQPGNSSDTTTAYSRFTLSILGHAPEQKTAPHFSPVWDAFGGKLEKELANTPVIVNGHWLLNVKLAPPLPVPAGDASDGSASNLP